MKKIKIKPDPLRLVKETKEERKERIHKSNLRTRVVESKKRYNRNKFKKGENF